MARGGFRPGAGRPKGAKGKPKPIMEDVIPSDVARAAARDGMTPLEYALKVMNNADADQARRDRMCAVAMPFCHPRVADARVGKKDAKEEAATAAVADGWGGDLDFDRPH